MNPVLILTHNNLELTKRCVDSLRQQDIPTDIFIVDNGSTDGTLDWCADEHIQVVILGSNTGFSHGINVGLGLLFEKTKAQWCFVPNSDTEFAPWHYRLLLERNLPVVSGVQHIDGHRVTLEDLKMVPPIEPIRPNPDFSALLFRREVWESLGGFDERMKNYCSDCDMHVRAHLAGIGMFHAHIPYFHVGSATLANASPEECRIIQEWQRPDWGVFREKWGCLPGTPEYDALFAPELFGVKKSG